MENNIFDKIEEINIRLKTLEASLMTFINMTIDNDKKQEFLEKSTGYLKNITNNIPIN